MNKPNASDRITRWANKQPSLRMQDGGSMLRHPVEHYATQQIPMPTIDEPEPLQMADGGLVAGPRQNPLTPGKPQTPIPDWMRYSLRDGREVPGKGEGDKIPALLEPEEFVVSNSMMERKPGLRDTLHDIRDETLVAEGKDPRAVDAKQVRGMMAGHGQTQNRSVDARVNSVDSPLGSQGGSGSGRHLRAGADDQVGLRLADGGIPGMTVDEIYGRSKNVLSPEASAYLTEKNGPTGPPRPVGPAPAAAPTRASQLFGTGEQWKQTAGAAQATGERVAAAAQQSLRDTGMLQPSSTGKVLGGLGKLVGKVAPWAGVAEAGVGAYQGDTGRVATGAADTLAGLALATPAAPAAGVYFAGRGGLQAGSAIADSLGDDVKDAIGGTINNTLRRTPLIGKYLGVNDDAMNTVKAQANGLTPTPTAAARPPTPTAVAANGAGTNQAAYDAANADLGKYLRGPMGPPTDPNAIRVERQANGTTSFSGGTVAFNPDGGNSYIGPGAKSLRGNTPIGVVPADAGRPFGAGAVPGQPPARDPVAEFAAAAPKRGEFGYRQAQNDLARMRSEAIQTRGQDITSADGRYGHELTAANNRARLRYDMNKDQRDYGFSREKFTEEQSKTNFDARQKAQKDITDEIASYLPPGPDGKPDLAAAANHMGALNAHVSSRMEQLQQHLQLNPNDKTAASELQGLQARGVAQLSPQAKREFLVGKRAADVAKDTATGGLTPWGTAAVESDAPIKSLRKQKTLFGHDYISDRGDVIPGRYIDKADTSLGIGGRTNRNYDSLKLRD